MRWTPKGFDVWDAGAQAFGGDATLTFAIGPLGSPQKPHGRFDAYYPDADVAALTDFYALPGVRFAGSASGHNLYLRNTCRGPDPCAPGGRRNGSVPA